MNFKTFLTQSAGEIDSSIQDLFTEWSKETKQLSPRLVPHIKALQTATQDGKRIRGALVILGYTLVSKTPNPELLKIAAAYELFQTAILVHDDIIDSSPLRRGKPSLHMALGSGEYGTSQAICLGDIGFFLAYRLLTESSFDDGLKLKATTFFTQSIIKTTYGEMLDIELSYKNDEVTQSDILAVTRLKTAYYTFVAPLTLGAILAGAEDSFFEQLNEFGEAIGIAFQLQDDIKDVFGTEASLKKMVAGDILEGKQTLLIKKAKELADKKELEILEKYYGNSTIGEKEIALVKNIFKTTGALAYTESLARKYGKKARQVIPYVTREEQLQDLLGEMIDYIV